MRILHLSWEYPPLVYGGLGRHVHALAEAQAALGHDVMVVTQATEGAPAEEVVRGVRIIRASDVPPLIPFDTDHLLTWVLAMNHQLTRTCLAAWHRLRPDVIHAHDWLVAHTAASLIAQYSAATDADRINPALVATMHATESGRHQGWLPTPLSRSIHEIEGWLVGMADGVITCSTHMRDEISRLFAVPHESIAIIPNGIDRRRWAQPRQSWPGDADPLLVFCGRLEWEKGVHTLLETVPRLRRRYPGLCVVIAGDGSQREPLQELARRLRIVRRTQFTGWLPEPDLHALLGSADALIVPSLYEPFGLVALEGAALHAPLALARTGGLAEFAGDDDTAVTFPPGDVAGLARAVDTILKDPAATTQRVRRAKKRLASGHSWPALAESTVDYYVATAQSSRQSTTG